MLLRLLSWIGTVALFDRVKRLRVLCNSGQLIKHVLADGFNLPEKPVIGVECVLQAACLDKVVSINLYEQLLRYSLGVALLSCDQHLDTDPALLKILELGLNLTDLVPTLVKAGLDCCIMSVQVNWHGIIAHLGGAGE